MSGLLSIHERHLINLTFHLYDFNPLHLLLWRSRKNIVLIIDDIAGQ